jgi:prepilin-type N-terminal cleavage/methylation domain-containing protein
VLPTISRTDKQKSSGFTLIETLVSLAIMAVIAIGIMGAQGGHVRTADNSKKRTICTSLAEQGVEQMIALPFDDLLNNASPSTEDYDSMPNFAQYKRITRIDAINDDLISIQVEVFWPEAEKANTPSVLRMLRTRPPEKGK